MRRLIVLVPDQGVYGAALAQHIRDLAAPCEINVALVCVMESGAVAESALRLRLATLAASIGDGQVDVTANVVSGQSWIGAVQRMWQPGDIVICCAEHRVPTVATGQQPLYHVLSWLLDIPVYVLAGLYTQPTPKRTPATEVRARLVRWLMLAGIVAGFFYAQAQINQLTAGLAHTVLFLFAVVVEIGLIVMWISLA